MTTPDSISPTQKVCTSESSSSLDCNNLLLSLVHTPEVAAGRKTLHELRCKMKHSGYCRSRRCLFDGENTSNKAIHKSPKKTNKKRSWAEEYKLKYQPNSFENLPSKSPPYAYARDAVRRKCDRQKLPGQTCDNWEKFYKFYKDLQKEWGDALVNETIEKASRHRYKYRRPKTPPGFWNPVFTPSPEKNE